jgi:hypothetical protein
MDLGSYEKFLAGGLPDDSSADAEVERALATLTETTSR